MSKEIYVAKDGDIIIRKAPPGEDRNGPEIAIIIMLSNSTAMSIDSNRMSVQYNPAFYGYIIHILNDTDSIVKKWYTHIGNINEL